MPVVVAPKVAPPLGHIAGGKLRRTVRSADKNRTSVGHQIVNGVMDSHALDFISGRVRARRPREIQQGPEEKLDRLHNVGTPLLPLDTSGFGGCFTQIVPLLRLGSATGPERRSVVSQIQPGSSILLAWAKAD